MSKNNSVDARFASLSKNPRFLKSKKKDQKVAIDKRFNAIFDDSNKTEEDGVKKAITDKYGRVRKESVASDLKRFYRIKDEDDEEKQESGGDEQQEVEQDEENESEEQEEDLKAVEADRARRMIRGEALVESSDEDEEQEQDEVDSDVEVEMLNNDEDEDEERDVEVLGPISHRFAAVNMDWDNIKAKDLYKVFDAFRPKSGVLKSVSIYKSEFGKERLEKEAREGPPKDIFGDKKSKDQKKEERMSLFGDEEGSKDFDDDALRKYQLERLRYFYAVAECDTPATANTIFTAVDGTEFEKSANVFNLQFIPTEMTFDDNEPVEVATAQTAHTDSYAPGNFSTAALQHSKAQLTWDLDDPDRVRVTRKKFSKDELKEMDFKAYLASDTEESSGDEEEMRERMKKYKSLVSAPDSDAEGKSDDDGEAMGNMEITFTPGLSENAAAKLKKLSKDKEEAENDNVFLQERRKRKEKAKLKKSLKDDAFFNDNGDDDGASSDDEPVAAAKPTTKKEIQTAKEKEMAELELMMFDESSTTVAKNHFDMKDVLKQEKQSGKKKKNKKGKKDAASAAAAQIQDDFNIDVKDSRFAELQTSHHFAIDPTNPQFKKTAAMKQLLESRKKTAVVESSKSQGKKASGNPAPAADHRDAPADNQDLMAMVNAIKRKSVAQSNQPQGKRNKLSK
ncbi:hypothetical protein BDR26DRAFT_837025 [Obelidium mucronatum]|nr:hypothetical protein BDR26DRAFT_837025 [Obelidium mucronatum]